MKKSLFYIATVALTLVSCNEEELVQVPTNQVNGVLTATFEQDAATRTSIGENNALAWSAGDAIAVFGENAVKYNLSTADNTTGTFVIEGDATVPENITGAAFPYAEDVTLSDNTLTMTLPATIDQTAAGELDLPMWGTVSESNIAFKHLAGVLKVNLTEVPTGYNTLTVTADKPISGSFSTNLDVQEGEYPVLASTSTNDADKTVTVTFTAATSEASDKVLYLPLPVGTYSSIVVSAGNGTDNKVLKQWTTEKTVARAKIYSTSVTDYTSVMNEEELVAAVAKGGEVTLGADVTLDKTLNISNDVTLNLNGKTLSGAFREPCIKSSGNLSISNGYITNDGGAVLATGGTLNMTDCYVTMTKGYRENAVEITGGTKAVITGGWYKSTETLATGEATDWYGIGIVDGEVELNTTVEGTFGGGVTLAPQSGNRPNVTITGGSYSGTIHHGLNMNGGDLALNGNIEFDGKGGDIRVYTYTGTINGVGFGEYGNKAYTLSELENIIGSITEATTVITPEKFVAAVANGGNVKLGVNMTLSETLNISNDVTLNLNGKTLAGAFREPCIKSSGNLSISNGYITNDGGAVLTTGGTLNMTDCYVTMTKGYRENAVEITGGTKAVITGGWYKSTEALATGEATDWYGIGIVDGEVELNTTVEGTFGGGVTLAPVTAGTPKVAIKGGSYSGTIHHGLNMNGGTLTLEGNLAFSGANGDIRVYTYTGTINGIGFGTEGDKTYTLETLMNFINNKEQQGDEDKK